MAKPSLASQKKVTADNLAGLGAARLAQILVEVADTRTDLKRRLRMELAAGLGAVHLAPEIDRRLRALETSKGQVTWRQKPAFLRDLDAIRGLVADQLGQQEPDAALERLWRFLATYRQTSARLREREPAFEAIYDKAAGDLGALLAGHDPYLAANALVDAAASLPQVWAGWMAQVTAGMSIEAARLALTLAQARAKAAPGWMVVVRHLADAAADVAAWRATYGQAAQDTPDIAVALARRWLAAGDVVAAGEALLRAAPKPKGLRRQMSAPDFAWESAWIDYLDAAGETDAAQAVRWASFQRTLDVGRAKAYVARFDDFDDVEAEAKVLAHAAAQADFSKGLALLLAWPALAEASQMILDRGHDARIDPQDAEAWANTLRRRFPAAAHSLLRRGAATAFMQRAFKMSERLTEEADAMRL